MQQDFDWLGIGGHDDELGDAAVECFGGFVGTLTELLVMAGLLDQIEDGVCQGGVGKRIRLWVGGGDLLASLGLFSFGGLYLLLLRLLVGLGFFVLVLLGFFWLLVFFRFRCLQTNGRTCTAHPRVLS